VTSRFYGAADELLKEYAWYTKTTDGEGTRPVGLLKPNDLGLFDMYGNVFEWCHERALPYSLPAQGLPSEDKEDTEDILFAQERPIRSSPFVLPASVARSANREKQRPSFGIYAVGLRVARTYHRTR
jgi:formylglycine-generating enzyme required for sulfatase activity